MTNLPPQAYEKEMYAYIPSRTYTLIHLPPTVSLELKMPSTAHNSKDSQTKSLTYTKIRFLLQLKYSMAGSSGGSLSQG